MAGLLIHSTYRLCNWCLLDLSTKNFSVLLFTELVIYLVLFFTWLPELFLLSEKLLFLATIFSVFLHDIVNQEVDSFCVQTYLPLQKFHKLSQDWHLFS